MACGSDIDDTRREEQTVSESTEGCVLFSQSVQREECSLEREPGTCPTQITSRLSTKNACQRVKWPLNLLVCAAIQYMSSYKVDRSSHSCAQAA